MKVFRIAVIALAVACSLQAQHEDVENLYDSAADVARGGEIFRSHCAVCHGLEGVGDRAPALTTGEFRYGGSAGALHETISRGVPGTEMPGVYFDGVEVWQLVAYVQSLASGAAVETATGDAVAGRNVFAARGCGGCHRVNREGGRSGPDLSRIGGSRSLKHLRAAIVDPNEKVLPKFWRVEAQRNDGGAVSGRLLNEDTFTLQLLTGGGRLASVTKSELADYAVIRDSAMPSYERAITGADLENLLAYLASLR